MECRDDEIKYRDQPLATIPGDSFHIISRMEIDLNCLGSDLMLLVGVGDSHCREYVKLKEEPKWNT